MFVWGSTSLQMTLDHRFMPSLTGPIKSTVGPVGMLIHGHVFKSSIWELVESTCL